MRALKVLWGLLVDDARLAIGLVVTLLLTTVVTHLHQAVAGAWVFWIGVLASLWISLEHALRKKIHS